MNISIIEDEKVLREKLVKKLSIYGTIVKWYKSFHDFMNNGIQSVSDLYIVDLSLPDGSWFEIITYLRQEKKLMSRIIVMSWFADVDKKLLWFELWIDDYITKPFMFDELQARIKAIFQRTNELKIEKQQIIYSELLLDLDDKELYLWSREISLTHKEYLMVELFLKNQWKLIDKNTLISYVWWKSDLASPMDNTINVTISKLKKKLQWEFDLQTKYNFGYILAEKKNWL